MTYDDRCKLRAYCRYRLYNLEQYFAEDIHDFFKKIQGTPRMERNCNQASIAGTPLNHIISNLMIEFFSDPSHIEFSPSIPEIESQLKSFLLKGLNQLETHQKLELSSYGKSKSPFDFTGLQQDVLEANKLIELVLSEAFLPLIALQFFLHNFMFILLDDKKLVEEETSMLVKKNLFEPLQDEIRELDRDLKTLEKVTDTVYIGLFKVNLRDFRRSCITKIKETIEETFKYTVYNKLGNMLYENHLIFQNLWNELLNPIDSVDNYMTMKSFVDSSEVRDQIRSIGEDIQLCKKLNGFEQEFHIRNDELMVEYYLAMNWVRDIEYIQSEVRKRLLELGPKFTEELKQLSEVILQELHSLQMVIKEFPFNVNLAHAYVYYLKTVEISRSLLDLQARSSDILKKQKVLEAKLSNFDSVDNEIKQFQKYELLWEFIAVKWIPVKDNWWKGLFQDLNKNEMANTLSEGSVLLKRLYDQFNDYSGLQEVIRIKQKEIEQFQKIYQHVAILKDPSFKDRHWESFFEDIRQDEKTTSSLYQGKVDLKRLTLSDLMDMNLTSHTSLLKQLLIKAKTEAEVEESIKETKSKIKKIAIKPRMFDADNSGLWIIPGISSILMTLEEHLSICKAMVLNPEYPEEFKRDLRYLIALVSHTAEIMKLIKQIQNKLIRFSPVFKFKDLSSYVIQGNILGQFLKVRQDFVEIMRRIQQKEMGFFLDLVGEDQDYTRAEKVAKGLQISNSDCDSIMASFKSFFGMVRVECPRYYYFSDDQMTLLCSFLKFPKSMIGLVVTLFKGIDTISLGGFEEMNEVESVDLVDLRSKGGELLTFTLKPLIDLSPQGRLPLVSIIQALESNIRFELLRSRSNHFLPLFKMQFSFTDIFKYAREKSMMFQTIRLILHICFDLELLAIYKASTCKNTRTNPVDSFRELRSKITSAFQTFFEYPTRYIAGQFTNYSTVQFYSHFLMMMKHFADTLDYLCNKEVNDMESFEYQALPKYVVKLDSENAIKLREELSEALIEEDKGNSPDISLCFANVVADQFKLDSQDEAKEQNSVNFGALSYCINYGDELLVDNHSLVISPNFERSHFYLISSICNNQFVLLKGLQGSGKNATLESLSYLTAKNHYEVDCSAEDNTGKIGFYLMGALTGGFWFTFKKLDSCSDQFLTSLSSMIETIRTSSMTDTVLIDGRLVTPMQGYSIFITYTLSPIDGNKNFGSLPIALLESFRVLTLAIPASLGIIGGLLSPVMIGQQGISWSAKLNFFAKIQGKVEYSEIENIEDQTEEERLARNTPFTLKTLCKLVKITVKKYFEYIDRQYEKYRDNDSSDYRMDISKVIIITDKNRVGIFTRLFLETFSEHCKRIELAKMHIKGLLDLLQESFKEEIEPVKHLPLTAPIGTIDKSFKENVRGIIKKYQETTEVKCLPKSEKTYSKIESFLKLILGSDEDRTNNFIVYGSPDSQKSQIISLLAFIYSELQYKNYRIYWLILECLPLQYLFGDSSWEGIFAEIFNQCQGLDLEESSSHLNKIHYLFQSNSNLYSPLADTREKKGRNQKPLSKAHSWIVLDGNAGKNNPQTSVTITSVMQMLSNLYAFKEINQHIGFSPNIKVFYELNTVGMLDPKMLTDMKLIYQEGPLNSLAERIEQWLGYLGDQDNWFSFRAAKLTSLLTGICLPFIENLIEIGKGRKPLFVYSTGSMAMLNSILNILEVFLNEFRKYHIIHEFDQMRANPDLFSTNKGFNPAVALQISNSAVKGLMSLGSQTRLALNAGPTNMIQSRSQLRAGAMPANTNNHFMNGINSPEEIIEWENRRLEALVMFSQIYGLFSLTFESQQGRVSEYLDEVLYSYMKKQKLQKSTFGCGFYAVLDDKKKSSITDYCFDLTKGQWTKWVDYKSKSGVIAISSDLRLRNFTSQELKRLNCQNARLLSEIEEVEITTSVEPMVGISSKNILESPQERMLDFFTNFLVSYNRHFVVVSDHHQGKSLMLTSILRKMIEQKRITTFNFQLQRGSDSVVIQSLLENNLMKEVGNIMKPHKNKIGVVWLDDVHMSTEICKPESLLKSLQTQNGWFSFQQKNFNKIQNMIFLLSMSVRESDALGASEAMGSVNLDILSKCPVLKMRRINQEEFVSIFMETVSTQIVSTPTSSKRAEEGLTSFLFKQFVNVIYHNLREVRELTSYRTQSINLDSFYQLAKTINCLNWREINLDKKNVQFVWLYLLRDFFSCDISFMYNEYKQLIVELHSLQSNVDIPWSVGNSLGKPRSKGSVLLNTNSEKTSSARFISIFKEDGEDIPKRNRGGSMNFAETEQTKKSSFSSMEKKVDQLKQQSDDSRSMSNDGFVTNSPKPSRFKHEAEKKKPLKLPGLSSPLSNQGKLRSSSSGSSSSNIKEELGPDSSSDSKSMSRSKSLGKSSKRSSSGIISPDSRDSPKKSRFFQQPGKKPAIEIVQAESADPKSLRSINNQAQSKRRIQLVRADSSNSIDSGPKALTIRDAEEDATDPISRSSSEESEEYRFILPDKQESKTPKHTMKQSAPNKRTTNLLSKMRIPKSRRRGSLESDIDKSQDSDLGSVDPRSTKYKIHENNTRDFVNEFINKIMTKGDLKSGQLNPLKMQVYRNKKVFFDAELEEAGGGDELDKDYDLIPHSFEIIDTAKDVMLVEFLKSSLRRFIVSQPENAFWLRLEGQTMSQFMMDFNSFQLALQTEFQHLLVSCIKSSHYVRHLISFICSCQGSSCYYYDLSLDDSYSAKSSLHHAQDTFRQIKTNLYECFESMTKNNKRVVFIIEVGSLETNEQQAVASKIYDLASSIIFNTDMILQHFADSIEDFIRCIKKNRISSHYEDYFATYLVRNNLESKVTFVFLNESNTSEFYRKNIRQKNPAKSTDFSRFLCENYPKLFARLKKVVVNGLKATTLKTFSFEFQSIIPWEDTSVNRTLLRAIYLENTFLRKQNKNLSYFYSIRPFSDNVVLFNHIKHYLNKKFQGKHGERDAEAVEREQKQLVERVMRRKDILKWEIDKLKKQIIEICDMISMLKELKDRLESQVKEIEIKKLTFDEGLKRFEEDMNFYKQQDQKLMNSLREIGEAQEILLTFREKELYTQLSFGGFYNSPIFALYSVIFHEIFEIQVEPKLTVYELRNLNLSTIEPKRVLPYSKNMVKLLEEHGLILAKLKEAPKKREDIQDRLAGIDIKMNNLETKSFVKYNEAQRVFVLWIGHLLGVTISLNEKTRRDFYKDELQGKIEQSRKAMYECDSLTIKLNESTSEQEQLVIQKEEVKTKLQASIEFKKDSIEILGRFVDNLIAVQALYMKTTSPFLAYSLDKAQIIDLLACYMLLFSKFPFQAKRVLFFVLLKSLNQDPEVFNEVPVYDFLSSEPPLISAMKSSIPFNHNMLNNVAMFQFYSENSFPFCIVNDIPGIFIRWLEEKYSRFLMVDYCIPSETTLDRLEDCIKEGRPYLVVDPKDELLRIIKPIIEWRFKRFSEGFLETKNIHISPTFEITIAQRSKQIIYREGFKIIIVLQKIKPENFDQSLFAMTMFLNNDSSERKIWNETLAEELVIEIESDHREQYLKNFMQSDLKAKIYDKYTEMTTRLATFDFISDSLTSDEFKAVEELLCHITELSNQQNEIQEQKKAVLLKLKQENETRDNMATDVDLMAENFMNNHYASTIPGYSELYERYSGLADRIRVYQLANEKFGVFIGENLTTDQESFIAMFKECVGTFRSELLSVSTSSQKSAGREQFESVYSKIEKNFYNQIINSVPQQMRYLYNFLCSLVHMFSNNKIYKKYLVKSLYLFLYSESLVPKANRQVSFVNNRFYDKFNALFHLVKSHFCYSSSNMPELLSSLQDFGQLHNEAALLEQLKSSFKVTGFDDLLDPFKDKSKALAMSALLGEKREIRRLERSNSHTSSSSEEDHIIDEIVKKIQQQNSRNAMKGNSSMLEDYESSQHTQQHVQSHKSIFTKQMTIELIVDKYGNVGQDETENKENKLSSKRNLTAPRIMDLKSIPMIAESSREAISPTSKSSPKREESEDGSPASKKSVNTFKIATYNIIKKFNLSRYRKFRFVDNLVEYLANILSTITKIDKDQFLQSNMEEWKEFLTLSRSALLPVKTKSLLPHLPIKQSTLATVGRIDILSIYKYARPDFLHYILQNFYAELRGVQYSRLYLDLGRFIKGGSFQKPFALVYSHPYRSPFATLQRVVDSMNFRLHLIRLEPRYTIANIYRELEELSLTNSWLVIENIDKMESTKAFVLVRSINTFLRSLDKNTRFKVWFLYLNVNQEPGEMINTVWPEWLASCYQVHLSEHYSIRENMIGLYWKEIYRLNAKLPGVLEGTDVKNKNLRILTRGRSITFRESELEPSENVSSQPKVSEREIGSDEESKLSKPINLQTSKNPKESLFSIVCSLNQDKSNCIEYTKDHRSKIAYCLKFHMSSLRQRYRFLAGIVGKRAQYITSLKYDEEIEEFLEELFKDTGEKSEEPLIFLYKYLCNTLFSSSDLTSIYQSKLQLKSFMETFINKNTDVAITITIERESYNIPEISNFANFKDVFNNGILKLPAHDNYKVIGFKNNQEIQRNYYESKKCFKVLTNYFHETKLDELDDRLLDRKLISEMQEGLKGSDHDIEISCITGYLEYGILLIDRYEQTVGFTRESASISQGITKAFHPKYFEQMAKILSSINTLVAKEHPTPHRSKGSVNFVSADKDSWRSGMDKKEDSGSYRSEGVKTKVSLEAIRNMFRKSLLTQEFKILKKTSHFICTDLNLMKLYLCGEPIYRVKEKSGKILESFLKNEIPTSWRSQLAGFNINQENFSLLVRSLMLKLDQLYNLVVKLQKDLPPVIPINRLLDPQGFFVNLIQTYCKIKGWSPSNCQFIMECGYKSKQNHNTQSIKVAGITIKGGCIDSQTNMLVDEAPRQFESNIGRVYLDVVESDPIPDIYLEDSMHIPFILWNTAMGSQSQVRCDFYRSINKEIENPSSLYHNIPNQNPAEMRKVMQSRLKRQLTLTGEVGEKYIVRIPVYFSSQSEPDPVSSLGFYLYALSPLDQMHWMNKGTFVCLMEY